MRKEVCCFSWTEGGVHRNASIKKAKKIQKEVRHRSLSCRNTSFSQCKVCSSNVKTSLEHEGGFRSILK